VLFGWIQRGFFVEITIQASKTELAKVAKSGKKNEEIKENK
jgi:hypothetical protein